MSNAEKVIAIQLLDRKFQVKCSADQSEILRQASDYLANKMSEVRDGSKVIGAERIAMVTALNIAYELLVLQQQKDSYLEMMSKRIEELQKKIESALAQNVSDHV
jgi:cell division protein ZapA